MRIDFWSPHPPYFITQEYLDLYNPKDIPPHPNFDSDYSEGDTINDIQVDVEGNIYLRAERDGNTVSRIYTITYTATDSSGNSATSTATVTVPHNQ